MVSREKDEEISSISLKVEIYCGFVKEVGSPADYPVGLLEGVREAASKKKLTFLRSVSKELNTRVRDTFEGSEQNQVILRMQEAGVNPADLPISLTKKHVAEILKRGVIRTEEERQLVKGFVTNEFSRREHSEDAMALAALLDRYEVKRSKAL